MSGSQAAQSCSHFLLLVCAVDAGVGTSRNGWTWFDTQMSELDLNSRDSGALLRRGGALLCGGGGALLRGDPSRGAAAFAAAIHIHLHLSSA